MSNLLWPISPVPGNMQREPQWASGQVRYDSGVGQGWSNWQQPLYRFVVPFTNIPQSKMNSLEAFYNDPQIKSSAGSWLFKDPYGYQVGSALLVQTGTNASTAAFYTVQSFRVTPEAGNFSIISHNSGTLTVGVDYNFDQTRGIATFSLRASSGDYYYVSSMEFFRRVRFEPGLNFTSPIWQQHNGQVSFIEEIPK